MTRGALNTDSAVVVMVVELVTRTPGIESATISQTLGRSRSHVLKALHAGRQNDLIGCVYIGPKRCGWFPVDLLAQAQADWRQQMEQRRTASTARRLTQMLEKQAADDEADDQPKRRFVPAGCLDPLPFVCRAVNSVFALGAA